MDEPTPNGEPAIKGGYYLKARCVQNAEIATAPPHVREIWDWLLKEANHSDAKVAGTIILRGQCIRSYKDIQESLYWMVGWRKCTYSKDDCETAMKWLKKRGMVTIMKTTRGMLITIVKYDFYQNPKNYENHKDTDKKTTRKPQSRHTINNKKKNETKENIYTPEFELFYKSYPRHEAGQKAFNAWKGIDIQNETLEAILQAVERQKAFKAHLKATGQFCPEWPMPATWLNGRRWEDELPETAAAPSDPIEAYKARHRDDT